MNVKKICAMEIYLFITLFVDCPQYAYIVRDVCYLRDYVDHFVLTSTEIDHLIEYVCLEYCIGLFLRYQR